MKKYLSLITIIFILMVYSITGYKVFGEEFIIPIIPIRYDEWELSYNATHDVTHYIHSFSVGDTVFTQLKAKIYQKHWAYGYLISQGYKPYRDGTNLIINVSIGIDLSKIFDMYYPIYYNIYRYPSWEVFNYSFRENYINIPAFRTEIKRLADFLDRSGVIYSTTDYSITFNSVLSNNIIMVNYLQKVKKHLEKSIFMQTLSNLGIANKKWQWRFNNYTTKFKFQVGKRKFKYELKFVNSETGGILLNKYELEQFQAFLDKKKINLKLSEHIKAEADDVEASVIKYYMYSYHGYTSLYEYNLNTEYEYKHYAYYWQKYKNERGEEAKYCILQLKDFIIE